ncbi:MAG: hypothetical protein ABI180_09770 [Microcoleus sp.]|jgi:hypothetical protein
MPDAAGRSTFRCQKERSAFPTKTVPTIKSDRPSLQFMRVWSLVHTKRDRRSLLLSR